MVKTNDEVERFQMRCDTIEIHGYLSQLRVTRLLKFQMKPLISKFKASFRAILLS